VHLLLCESLTSQHLEIKLNAYSDGIHRTSSSEKRDRRIYIQFGKGSSKSGLRRVCCMHLKTTGFVPAVAATKTILEQDAS
jgi:hypothetical protein